MEIEADQNTSMKVTVFSDIDARKKVEEHRVEPSESVEVSDEYVVELTSDMSSVTIFPNE